MLGVAHEIMAMVDYQRVNQHLHQQKETAEEMLRQLHRAKDELKQWLDAQATEVVSVAHDLARYSGGTLAFRSQVGIGTTVTIQLPCAPHSAVHPPTIPMSVIAGFTFLIVEDTSIGNELASLLQTQGASATVVMSVTAAQQWLQEQEPSTPHVAIIDYHLPGSVSGTTFAMWMQQQPYLQSTLRISWSALPRESVCAGWVEDPHAPLYHGFIRKSSDLVEVIRRLGNMVHHYALDTHLRNGNHV